MSSASIRRSANSGTSEIWLVAKRFQTRAERVDRAGYRLRRRGQELAQDECRQVARTLRPWKGDQAPRRLDG